METSMLRVVEAEPGMGLEQAHQLFEEYARSLETDLEFQDFAEELATLPGNYARPRGRLLLVLDDSEPAGCVALRPLSVDTCEMKRLYVRPNFREMGVGRLLTARVLDEARRAGYHRIRLDSLPAMTSALSLYRKLGFREIAPYRENPIPGTVFLELQLDSTPDDS
jgi:putative acetyltransferase